MTTIDRIEALRQEIKKACDYVEKNGGVIQPGNFGTDNQLLEVQEGCCYCPVGALELLRKQRRVHFVEFNYDAFVEGFDSDLAWEDVEGGYREPEEIELFKLGHEFRKQYVKEAA
jgi:hypothetical protein